MAEVRRRLLLPVHPRERVSRRMWCSCSVLPLGVRRIKVHTINAESRRVLLNLPLKYRMAPRCVLELNRVEHERLKRGSGELAQEVPVGAADVSHLVGGQDQMMEQHADLGDGTGCSQLADAAPDTVDVRSVGCREVEPRSVRSPAYRPHQTLGKSSPPTGAAERIHSKALS